MPPLQSATLPSSGPKTRKRSYSEGDRPRGKPEDTVSGLALEDTLSDHQLKILEGVINRCHRDGYPSSIPAVYTFLKENDWQVVPAIAKFREYIDRMR